MVIENRQQTVNPDIRELVKMANDEEAILQVNFDGFIKQANSHKFKDAVVVVATGDRAVKLRAVIQEMCS